MRALLQYRRGKKSFNHAELIPYSDTVYPFVKNENSKLREFGPAKMARFFMEHASQAKVCFYLNLEFCPDKEDLTQHYAK